MGRKFRIEFQILDFGSCGKFHPLFEKKGDSAFEVFFDHFSIATLFK